MLHSSSYLPVTFGNCLWEEYTLHSFISPRNLLTLGRTDICKKLDARSLIEATSLFQLILWFFYTQSSDISKMLELGAPKWEARFEGLLDDIPHMHAILVRQQFVLFVRPVGYLHATTSPRPFIFIIDAQLNEKCLHQLCNSSFWHYWER